MSSCLQSRWLVSYIERKSSKATSFWGITTWTWCGRKLWPWCWIFGARFTGKMPVSVVVLITFALLLSIATQLTLIIHGLGPVFASGNIAKASSTLGFFYIYDHSTLSLLHLVFYIAPLYFPSHHPIALVLWLPLAAERSLMLSQHLIRELSWAKHFSGSKWWLHATDKVTKGMPQRSTSVGKASFKCPSLVQLWLK